MLTLNSSCWISTNVNGVIWFFVGPMLAIILVSARAAQISCLLLLCYVDDNKCTIWHIEIIYTCQVRISIATWWGIILRTTLHKSNLIIQPCQVPMWTMHILNHISTYIQQFRVDTEEMLRFCRFFPHCSRSMQSFWSWYWSGCSGLWREESLGHRWKMTSRGWKNKLRSQSVCCYKHLKISTVTYQCL